MRAVVYARYSSHNQRDASIEDQVRVCRERIEREGWGLVTTYCDHALSGASRFRPDYQKLLEDARAGGFDVVVAEALVTRPGGRGGALQTTDFLRGEARDACRGRDH